MVQKFCIIVEKENTKAETSEEWFPVITCLCDRRSGRFLGSRQEWVYDASMIRFSYSYMIMKKHVILNPPEGG